MWLEIFNEKIKGYYVKYTFEDDLYQFFVSNFIKIWECRLTHEELFNILEENNPLLISDDASFVDNSLQLFFNNISIKNEKSNFVIKFSDEEKEINLHITLFNETIIMKLPLKFTKSDSSMFCKHVTTPMIMKLNELQSSEDQLISLILKKDKEISLYKAEGAIITIKHLETQSFNAEQHKNKKSDNFISKETLTTIAGDLGKLFNIPNNTDKIICNAPESNNTNQKRKSKIIDLPKAIEVKNEPKEDIKPKSESLIIVKPDVSSNEVKRKKPRRRELNF